MINEVNFSRAGGLKNITTSVLTAASVLHLANTIIQKCIWQTHATQGSWRRSHSALYGPILFTAWGLADWAILVRLPGSSSWPTLIPQVAKLSGPPGWLLGTFQFARCEESHLVPWWVRGRQGKTHNTHVELCIGALHTINSWCMYNLQYIKLITVLRKWANTY